jgi:acyl-CoA synthetase (AMP-forming)/AMP-acid ligase II
MMRLDSHGRLFFVDRLGDTFRWKSENVSTNEVCDVLGLHSQVAEANVYGIQVPHADGRCGMAAVVTAGDVREENFDFEGIATHLLGALPRYAVPYFIRITEQMDHTGTMKLQKGRLKREGIDPEMVQASGDKLYWLPGDGKKYVPFRLSDYEDLKEGRVRI